MNKIISFLVQRSLVILLHSTIFFSAKMKYIFAIFLVTPWIFNYQKIFQPLIQPFSYFSYTKRLQRTQQKTCLQVKSQTLSKEKGKFQSKVCGPAKPKPFENSCPESSALCCLYIRIKAAGKRFPLVFPICFARPIAPELSIKYFGIRLFHSAAKFPFLKKTYWGLRGVALGHI